MASSTKTWNNNQAPSCEDDDLNGFKLENNNLIEGTGQTLNTGDNQQSHKAVAAYAAMGQFFTGGGVADAYTANAPAPRINPESLIDGMIIRFIPVADNTGACTVNPFGLGDVDIKLKGGVLDPAGGDIKQNQEVFLAYRLTYFELSRRGKVKKTVIESNDPSWEPQPDTVSIEIIATGGGGGAGNADGQGASTAALSGGGGAGGTVILCTNNVDPSYNITIGTGGVGASGSGENQGAGGNNTTVISSNINLLAEGANGGDGMIGDLASETATGGIGGDSSGGDINISGMAGQSGIVRRGRNRGKR